MELNRRHCCTATSIIAAAFIALLILAALAGAQNVNVAGTWHGAWNSNVFYDSGGITSQMSQSGSSLSGTIQLTNSQCTSQVPITGNVQGNIATFNASCSGCSLAFTQGVVQSNTMNGNYTVYCGTSLYDSGTFSLTESITGTATEKILWTNSSYAVSISSLDSSGNQTSTMTYGPYSGWIPGTYVLNTDGTARLVWTTSSGQVSIWRLDSSNNNTGSAVYGPYSGWTPVSYKRNPDGTARIFWTSNTGQVSIWRLDSSDNYVGSTVYGPYSGWTPGIYALRPDDTTRIVWTSTSGQASVWRLDSSGNYVGSTVYGPYPGYTPVSYVPRPDGTDALVWTSTSGQISIWRLDSSGNYVYSKVYGFPSGYTPVSYVPKPDGTARFIWTSSSNPIDNWSLDSSDNHIISTVYPVSPDFPLSGYVPDPDGTARIVLTHSSGQIIIWRLDSSDNDISNFVYSPVSGWTAMGYAVVGYYCPVKLLNTTTVPNVVGMSETAAVSAITAAGLTVGTITTQASSSVASGNIISQSPAAGTSVAQGSSVALVVSSGSGPPMVTVPNVVGMSQSAATSAITAAGLTVGTITTQASTTVAAGNVISQSPAAGTSVSGGSSVALIVSSTPTQVTVPNVVGMSQSAATSAITAAGLNWLVTPQSSSTVSAGVVISETPAAGTIVAQGLRVSLVVSTGPPAMVIVPNVVGLTQSAATSAITGAGLTVGTITTQASSTVAAGYVISETPAAGTSVAAGSSVSLVVSSGPAGPVVYTTFGAGYATGYPNYYSAGWSAEQNYIRMVAAPFTLSAPATVTSIEFAGYDGYILQFNSLTVSIYSDASGMPGSIIAQTHLLSLPAYDSSKPTVWSAVFQNVQLAANTRYWVSLAAYFWGDANSAEVLWVTSGNGALGVAQDTNCGTGPPGCTPVWSYNSSGTAPAFAVIAGANTMVTMPNVVGMSETAAFSTITAANLTVGTLTTQGSTTIASGNVASESPAAGSSIAYGSPVAIVVSTGSVAVPNVVGMTLTAAEAYIGFPNGLGGPQLTVGTVTNQYSSSVAAGDVISTSPAAGTIVANGSTVNLVVSSGPAPVYTLTVTSNYPYAYCTVSVIPGTNCTTAPCTRTYTQGTVVTLTMVACSINCGGSFVGCDSGSGSTCTVTMNSNRTVEGYYVCAP